MASRSHLRPLPFTLAVLILALLPISSFPMVRACINPPDTCTTRDFDLSMEDSAATVNQGNPPLGLAIIYGFSNAYFSGSVNLSLTITPNVVNGPTLTLEDPVLYFIPAVFRGSGVEISAGLNTPQRNYNVTVTGTGNNVTHRTFFILTVAPPIPPDGFNIGLNPIPTEIQPGDQSDVTVGVSRNGPPHMVPIDLRVQLSLTITPPNELVATGFPGSFYIGTYDAISTTFNIQSSSTTTPGVYTINATGTNYQRSQSLSHSAIATLTVGIPASPNPPPNPSSSPSTPQPSNNGSPSNNRTSSVLTATINRPFFWYIATGVVVYTLLSFIGVALAIRRNRRK